MKIKDKIQLTDLYFGYKNYAMSYTSGEERKIETHNLFDSIRVLRSVALWALMPEKEKKEHDALSWCFMDVGGRAEYEFIMSPWVGGGEAQKVNIYQMYVEPNRELLLDLIARVTPNSARKYLREERKRYGTVKITKYRLMKGE